MSKTMNINKYIKALRPRFCFLQFGLFFYFAKLVEVNSSMLWLQCFLISVPFCFFYGLNDIFDYESDKLNPRKTQSEFGGVVLDPKMNKNIVIGTVVSAIAMILTSFLTFNPLNIFITFLMIFCFTFYSVPPLRFKDKPIIDFVSSTIIYYSIAIIPLTYSGLNIQEIFTKTIFLIPTLISWHLYGELMDLDSDKKAKMNTTAVFFGYKVTSFIILISALTKLLFFSSQNPIVQFTSILFLLSFVYLVIQKSQKKYEIFARIGVDISIILFLVFILSKTINI